MKHSRKIIAILLTLALSLGISVSAFAAPGPEGAGGPGGPGGPMMAADTGASEVAEFADKNEIGNLDSVDLLVSMGIVGGSKAGEGYLFDAGRNVTRAEAAKMVALASTLGEDVKGEAVFADVAEDHWAKDYIAYCADKGIMDGKDGQFDPNGAVSALDLSAMLTTAVGSSGLAGDPKDGPATRDTAALMIATALKESGKVSYITESQTLDTLTIAEGQKLVAPSGKTVTLTVDGVETRPAAGTYANAVLTVADVVTAENMGMTSVLRIGAYINNGKVEADASVLDAVKGTVTDTEAVDVVINSQNDEFSGILVDGDSEYTVKNAKITLNGHGKDDFAGTSAGLAVRGNATLTVENADIDTTGSIRTAIWAGGNSKLLVKNSRIVGRDGDDLDFEYSMMNEVPWVLGLKGNLRSTGLLATAQATYLNSYVEAENWGALSTDSNQVGATLTAINTEAVISGESGYASYADQQVQNYYYGSTLKAPDMGLIVAAGQCGAVFGAATEENVGSELYAQIPADRQNAKSVVESGSFGVMWHKNQNGVVDVREGTIFNTGETAFLIKSDVAQTAYPVLKVDNSEINSGTGVILHLMEADDAGMGGGAPGSPDMWAKEYKVPTDTTPVKDDSDPTVVGETTVKASFSNMAVNGDIYNSRFTAGQNLAVDFVNAQITGVISAGTQAHRDAAPGASITKEEYNKIGHVVVTPAEAVCNGVIVTLSEGTVWNVTGTSYLTSLTIDEGCTINGTMTVNGVETPVAAGTYTGTVVVSPAN